MRSLILAALVVVLLSACQRSEDAATVPAAPAATEQAPAPVVAEAPAAPAAPPVREVPVGTCGDQSAVAEADRVANTARWSTASELDNFGYDVYRGDSEEGPFERLTADPIQGAGTTDEPQQYSYRDENIDPCKAYWYYVEAISTSGTREKFTPVFQAPAKRRAAD